MGRPSDSILAERALLDSEGSRRCNTCKEVKNHSFFGRMSVDKMGLQRSCRECINHLSRTVWYPKEDPLVRQKKIERLRNWRKSVKEDPEKHAAQRVKDRSANLKRLYKLTDSEYSQMSIIQGGVCAICGGNTKGNLHVDHDHQTGKIRGLLCGRCNPALGAFSTVDNLQKAITYLRRH